MLKYTGDTAYPGTEEQEPVSGRRRHHILEGNDQDQEHIRMASGIQCSASCEGLEARGKQWKAKLISS